MIITNYAAIDIGSNAVRLLISTVTNDSQHSLIPHFRKTSLTRVPLRLGTSVFTKGKLLDNDITRLMDTMKAFQLIIKTYGIERYYACATSAMRDAQNGPEVVEKVFSETGLKINIIDGDTEARILSQTDLQQYIEDDKNYLYVDVGGGSTEYTLLSDGKAVASESFRLGTVRLLHNLVPDETWKEAEKWVRDITRKHKNISMIGSGGNINYIFKVSNKKAERPLSRAYIENYSTEISDYSYKDKILKLNMKPDRADVIEHASRIYLSSMKWARSQRMFVPKIGLADGIVKLLYYNDVEKLNGH